MMLHHIAHWTECCARTGDIIYVEVFGKPMVIINSVKIAKDLLDKRSLIYSDRPRLVSPGSSSELM